MRSGALHDALNEKPGRVPTLPVPNDRVKGAGPVPGPAPPFLGRHQYIVI